MIKTKTTTTTRNHPPPAYRRSPTAYRRCLSPLPIAVRRCLSSSPIANCHLPIAILLPYTYILANEARFVPPPQKDSLSIRHIISVTLAIPMCHKRTARSKNLRLRPTKFLKIFPYVMQGYFCQIDNTERWCLVLVAAVAVAVVRIKMSSPQARHPQLPIATCQLPGFSCEPIVTLVSAGGCGEASCGACDLAGPGGSYL